VSIDKQPNNEQEPEIKMMVEYAIAMVPASQGAMLANVLTDNARRGWDIMGGYGGKMPKTSVLDPAPAEDAHVILFRRFVPVPETPTKES
jgi:hypothetical protein